MSSDAHLTVVLTKLALNYNRTLDEDALLGLLATWRDQVGACTERDIEAGATALMRDPTVDRFPTAARFRQAVVDAAQARQRAALAEASATGTVACLTCQDSGWVLAGTDEDRYEYVDKCPQGCLPPLPGARYRRHSPQRRRKREGHQTTLADVLPQTLPAGVIDVTHRIEGDRDGQDPLDF